jgi:basic membrane protein A and related proteins
VDLAPFYDLADMVPTELSDEIKALGEAIKSGEVAVQ